MRNAECLSHHQHGTINQRLGSSGFTCHKTQDDVIKDIEEDFVSVTKIPSHLDITNNWNWAANTGTQVKASYQVQKYQEVSNTYRTDSPTLVLSPPLLVRFTSSTKKYKLVTQTKSNEILRCCIGCLPGIDESRCFRHRQESSSCNCFL